jgi:hypothetical protein
MRLFGVTKASIDMKIVSKRERMDVLTAATLLALGLLGAFMVGAV